jgi:hypothetical protein
MANVRKHIRVSWNNARDIAEAAEMGGENAALSGFAVAYCALRRNKVDVPPWELFLDQLDTLSTGSNGTADDVVGPTPLAGYTVER